jgi:CHAT domain-containing protein
MNPLLRLLVALTAVLVVPASASGPQAPVHNAQELQALTLRAEAAFTAGDLETSVSILRERRARATQLGDAHAEAWTVKQIAYYARVLGDYDLMLESAQEALRLYLTTGPADEGWLTVGLAYEALNASRDAAKAYDNAHALQTGTPSGVWLDRSGQMWEKAGELSLALARYEDAVRLDQARGILNGQLRSRARAAALLADTGDRPRARAHLEAIDALIDASGTPAGAMVLQLLGLAYFNLGERPTALRYLNDAEAAVSRGQIVTLDHLRTIGLAFLRVSSPERAMDCFTEAIALADQGHMPLQQARLRAFRASAARDAGRFVEARADLEWALPVFESARASVTRPQLRAEYFGTLQRHYELYIDVLMRLGEAPRALEASERARARLLAEVLISSGVDTRLRAPEGLLSEEADVRRRLTTLSERRQALAGTTGRTAAQRMLSAELRAAEQRFDEIQARISAARPETAGLLRPTTPDLHTIQGLLGADAVLLEFALGETRSYLFVVTGDSFNSFQLAGRDVIETAARRLHSRVSRRPPSTVSSDPSMADARSLAELVLADARPLLRGRRLAVVSDGALQYVPFHVMPELATAEIVHLPSASVLALQRGLWDGRPPASKRAIVLADPVFTADDPRLGRQAVTAPPSDRAAASLPRLTFSRREAQAISTSFPGEAVFVATDFAASKDLATSAALLNYRIIHIASHGIVDTAQGQTSALVLSQVTDKGRPRDGRLGLHDIYTLRLSADLVVLSACETALGPEVRGEGLTGMARGFMHAGARRVIASLWKVDDAASSELMKAFYGAVQRGDSPSAALRHAQAHVRAQSRWRDPYYWAGFQLYGDWR